MVGGPNGDPVRVGAVAGRGDGDVVHQRLAAPVHADVLEGAVLETYVGHPQAVAERE